MSEWWDSLSLLQRVFAWIGIPATLVLIVQTVLMFFGIGDGDGDADFDGDGFSDGDDGLTLFSVRGIVAMLCVAGWSGIVFVDCGIGNGVSVLLAVICGLAALFGMAFLMRAMVRLQSSGNIDLGSAVGKTGEVYIPIPAAGEGKGKISIVVQDRLIEIDAVTDGESLKTGDAVRVVSTDGNGLVLVEKLVKRNSEKS